MRSLVLLPIALLVACTPTEVKPPPKPVVIPSPASTETAAMPTEPKNTLAYPRTRKDNTQDNLFGVTVPDPYRWLEDGKSGEVQDWMKAQDSLARAELAKLPERDAIAKRLKDLFYIESLSAPRH